MLRRGDERSMAERMSAQPHPAAAPPSRGLQPGHRFAVASLLMIPAAVVLFVPLMFLGSWLQRLLGLAEDDLLIEAGVWGVAAAALMMALLAAPPLAGVALGIRARRLGERRLGMVGVVANLVVGVWFVLVPALGLVFA